MAKRPLIVAAQRGCRRPLPRVARAAVIAAWVLLAFPVAAGAADATSGLEFVSPDTLTVKAGADGTTKAATVWLHNGTATPVQPRLKAVLEADGKPANVRVVPDKEKPFPEVPANDVAPLHVVLKDITGDDSLSGELVASAEKAGAAALSTSVEPDRDYDPS